MHVYGNIARLCCLTPELEPEVLTVLLHSLTTLLQITTRLNNIRRPSKGGVLCAKFTKRTVGDSNVDVDKINDSVWIPPSMPTLAEEEENYDDILTFTRGYTDSMYLYLQRSLVEFSRPKVYNLLHKATDSPKLSELYGFIFIHLTEDAAIEGMLNNLAYRTTLVKDIYLVFIEMGFQVLEILANIEYYGLF